MSEGEKARLVAWDIELRAAHDRLRAALRLVRENLGGDADAVTRDLLLYCQGFCVALSGHHVGEDRGLFPELRERHPALRGTIAKLEQDHSMIAHLLAGLEHALRSSADPATLDRHLEGIAAIMESHFRYEERELLDVLAGLDGNAEPRAVLGPL